MYNRPTNASAKADPMEQEMPMYRFAKGITGLLAGLVLTSSLFASPDISPTTAPSSRPSAPIVRASAEDHLIDLRGATGQLADWLNQFEVKPERFDYTMQLWDEDDYVQVYRLTFASPFVSPWPENNVVPAEFYLPRKANGKIRAAIVLDIMAGNAILARSMARGLAEGGVAALYVPMAYYNQRRPKNDPHFRIFDRDPTRAVDAIRQTVMDVRRAKAILQSRPRIDPDHVGITGISLGGIMTSLAAGVDGTFDRVVPILAGGDIASLVFSTPETRRLRAELIKRGITPEQLEHVLACVEPLNFASRIDPRRCLMINAAHDEIIPKLATDLLAKAIGSPELLWAPAGHYSAVVYLPAIRQTALRFLSGQTVDKLQY
jgi:dienelactone hydrolase